ncbi:MAG TPA: hypothetical protein VNQ90_06195, partial [Chthoniobacteraceae bacterium]|nr:hypothetical protein [Chthoniobacteraceae bacterium]
MASIYYRGKAPAGSWWLQYYHPRSGKLERFSLATGDRCAADLIRMRVGIEIELLKPTIASARVPAVVLENLGLLAEGSPAATSETLATAASERETHNESSPPLNNDGSGIKKENRATLIEGLERYIDLIRAENA